MESLGVRKDQLDSLLLRHLPLEVTKKIKLKFAKFREKIQQNLECNVGY